MLLYGMIGEWKVEWSFDDKLKCAEIAKNGDWLLGSVRKGSNDPKEFWEPSNLWCFCVHVDGKYTIERYRAMELIDEHGLEEPANDLARPIAEAAFRLDYLLDDEERLVSYAEWQLHDCYHRVLKAINQFERIDSEINRIKQINDYGMAEIKAILGGRFSEKDPGGNWRNFKDLISFESTVEDRKRRQDELYIQLGRMLSRGVHNAWLSPVNPQYGFDVGRMSFVMAMDRIGKICLNKKLVSVRGANYAKKIVELCGVDVWGG